MNTKRAKKIIDNINKTSQFSAYCLKGLDVEAFERCKIFLRNDTVSIYSISPNLRLIKEILNKDVLELNIYPIEETIEINNKNPYIRGIIGFLCFNLIGAIIGVLSATPTYKTKDVYNVLLKTTQGDICMQIIE